MGTVFCSDQESSGYVEDVRLRASEQEDTNMPGTCVNTNCLLILNIDSDIGM